MDPWNFGETGFDTSNLNVSADDWAKLQDTPVADVPDVIANKLAKEGVTPQQFVTNPQVATKLQDRVPNTQNVWDATPVSTPGGAAVSLPRTVSPAEQSASTANAMRTVSPADQSLSTQTPANMAATTGNGQTTAQRTENFLKALSAVKMPTQPTGVKVETPRAESPKNASNQLKTANTIASLLNTIGAQQTARKYLNLRG